MLNQARHATLRALALVAVCLVRLESRYAQVLPINNAVMDNLLSPVSALVKAITIDCEHGF